MSNLYELSKEVDMVVHEVIDAEGVLSPELESMLETVSLNFKDKSTNIGKWVLNLESNESAITEEIARLQRRREVQTNLKKRLMDYLKFCMENAGLNKQDLGTFTISIVKNPPSVGPDINESLLPEKYVRIVQTTTIDKRQLLDDLKREEIPGAYLVTDKTHLRIK